MIEAILIGGLVITPHQRPEQAFVFYGDAIPVVVLPNLAQVVRAAFVRLYRTNRLLNNRRQIRALEKYRASPNTPRLNGLSCATTKASKAMASSRDGVVPH